MELGIGPGNVGAFSEEPSAPSSDLGLDIPKGNKVELIWHDEEVSKVFSITELERRQRGSKSRVANGSLDMSGNGTESDEGVIEDGSLVAELEQEHAGLTVWWFGNEKVHDD